VNRLVGVYSDPNSLIIYPDGNKVQITALHFETQVIGGELGLSDETLAFGYFALEELQEMELWLNHKDRIHDTLAAQSEAFIK